MSIRANSGFCLQLCATSKSLCYLRAHLQKKLILALISWNSSPIQYVLPRSVSFYAKQGIIADRVKLWQRLGLVIECTKVQYDTETPNTPNLYFEMEHPDKSEALLSPACMITPCIEGLVCRFDFNSHRHRDERGRQRSLSGHTGTRRARANRSVSPTRRAPTDPEGPVDAPNQAQHDLDEVGQRRRKCTALLAIAGLYKVIGIGARFPGVRGMASDSTALLDLAPAVCNAHYMKVGRIT